MEKEIIHQEIPTNFVYPEVSELAYKFGSTALVGTPLRPDGDWRDFVPDGEEQSRNGIESSACYIEAQQHAISTILEEQYDVPNKNFSARFNAYLSGGTPSGGSPIAGADSIRHDGLIDDGMLPFSDELKSWNDFHSFKGANEAECRLQGKMWLGNWKPEYDIVIERFDAVADKYAKLREALKYSPIPISVTAWWQQGDVYIKPPGQRDNHLVECVYLDEDNHPYIWDSYQPYLKKLDKNFDFEFASRWSMTKLEPTPVPSTEETGLLALLKKLLVLLGILQKQIPVPLPPKPVPPPVLPTPSQKLYDTAYAFIGKHISLDESVPPTLGCAEALSTVLLKAKYNIPPKGIPGTVEMKKWLDKNFTKISSYEIGAVIISVTGEGIAGSHGHCGVCGKFQIMSNDSQTGLWSTHWTKTAWEGMYTNALKMPIYYYRPK